MDIALSKAFPFKREVPGGCRTSILTDRIEFIPYEIGEEFPEKKFNDCSKYTILTPDQSIISSSGKWIVKKKSDTNSHPEVNGYVKTSNLVTLNGFSTSNAAETNNNSTANSPHTNNKVNNNNVINNNSNVNGGGNEPMASPKIILYPDKKVQLEWNKVTKVGAGLINMGNTCYLNSVLQCLSYCSPLVNHLLYSGDDHSAKCKLKSFCMVCEFQQHLQRLYSNTNSAIKPSNIYSRLKSIARHFHPNRQEDAHEFLRYVLDHMWKSCLLNFEIAHNSVKLEPRSKETTVINKIFGGYHRSQVTCSQCKEKSNTYDYFMDFILDIKDAGNLEDAFRKFTQPELLQNENAYKCPNCKKKVAASKRFTIFRPPNVATVQFKRFDYNRIYGGKITKKISYPETFNIRPYMSDSKGSPIFYKLNAVLVHLGSTSNSGHYYCYIKSSNELWYLMDDDRVIQVNLAQVLDQQAYILFYIKVSAQNSYSTEIAKAEVHQALNSLHNNQPKTNGILNACRSLTVYPNGHLGKSQDQQNNKQLNGDRSVNLNNSLASIHSNGNKNSTISNSFFDGLVDKNKSSQYNSPIKPQHSLVNYDEDSSDDDDSSTSSPVNSTPSKSSTPTSNHTNGLISKKAEKRLMKLKKKNKKKRKRKKYESEELEWVERTKETVEKERRIKHQI